MEWKESTMASSSGKRSLWSVAIVGLLTPPIPVTVKTAWKEEKKKEENERS